MRVKAFHADSLVRGLRAAHDEQPEHPHVIMALEQGIPHCKIYHPLIPSWAKKFYKSLGNITNDKVGLGSKCEAVSLPDMAPRRWRPDERHEPAI